MTFEEALKKIDDNSEFTGTPDEVEGSFVDLALVTYIVENLRDEYAPTIEMTKQQATIFAEYWSKDTPIDTKTFEYPESEIMKYFNNRQLAQAWLHPESIKGVE